MPGGIVPADVERHLRLGLKTVYDQTFFERAKTALWPKLCIDVPSDSDYETYGWLGSIPAMREWKGQRVIRSVEEYGFTIYNKKFELTIGVDGDTLRREKYGKVRPRVVNMGVKAADHKDGLMTDLLTNGFTTACYDGHYFFADNHSSGSSGSQSNKGTAALDGDALKAGMTAMSLIVDDQGENMGITADTIVYGPMLQFTVMELIKAQRRIAAGGTSLSVVPDVNVLMGLLNPVMLPRMGTSLNWYLADTSKGALPLIMQIEREAEFDALEGSSEHAFKNDEYLYGINASHNAGYGIWQLMYGAVV
jgi:phage major head subunit gpT-like protein